MSVMFVQEQPERKQHDAKTPQVLCCCLFVSHLFVLLCCGVVLIWCKQQRYTNRDTVKRKTDRQTGRPTDRQTDRQTDRPTDRQTDKQTDRQAGRQTNNQTTNR